MDKNDFRGHVEILSLSVCTRIFEHVDFWGWTPKFRPHGTPSGHQDFGESVGVMLHQISPPTTPACYLGRSNKPRLAIEESLEEIPAADEPQAYQMRVRRLWRAGGEDEWDEWFDRDRM